MNGCWLTQNNDGWDSEELLNTFQDNNKHHSNLALWLRLVSLWSVLIQLLLKNHQESQHGEIAWSDCNLKIVKNLSFCSLPRLFSSSLSSPLPSYSRIKRFSSVYCKFSFFHWIANQVYKILLHFDVVANNMPR